MKKWIRVIWDDTPGGNVEHVGRHVIVIYEEIDDETVLPVTAYEIPEP